MKVSVLHSFLRFHAMKRKKQTKSTEWKGIRVMSWKETCLVALIFFFFTFRAMRTALKTENAWDNHENRFRKLPSAFWIFFKDILLKRVRLFTASIQPNVPRGGKNIQSYLSSYIDGNHWEKACNVSEDERCRLCEYKQHQKHTLLDLDKDEKTLNTYTIEVMFRIWNELHSECDFV